MSLLHGACIGQSFADELDVICEHMNIHLHVLEQHDYPHLHCVYCSGHFSKKATNIFLLLKFRGGQLAHENNEYFYPTKITRYNYNNTVAGAQ